MVLGGETFVLMIGISRKILNSQTLISEGVDLWIVKHWKLSAAIKFFL